MRVMTVGVVLCLCGLALARCGAEAGGPRAAAVALPASGRAYRGLDEARRAAVAASCRDRAAAAARGLASRELAAIDPDLLRAQLDDVFRLKGERRRSVAAVCREAIPFVTPGLRISFDGATGNGGASFAVQTSSDRPLRISGRIVPPPTVGRVIARRELAPASRHVVAVGGDGRFTLPTLRLRRLADNTFTITIQAPPHATRAVLFSAICLDCLAGAPPPAPES